MHSTSDLDTQILRGVSYDQVLEIQEQRRREILQGLATKECIYFVEHSPCITVGHTEKGDGLHVSAEEMRQLGISFFMTNRGGKATYHGPGQLVVYPILHLKRFNRSPKRYVCFLENCMIAIAKYFGVTVFRREGYPGVWTNTGKIGSLGIHIRKYVSIHGFALNIQTDLKGFALITPCGINDIKMENVNDKTQHAVTIDEVFDVAPKLVLEELGFS